MKASLRNYDKVKDFLATVQRGYKIVAMRGIAEYILGNNTRGLRHNPSRKTHGENNPYQWTSDAQRKKFFATNGFGGGIPYQRTGDLALSWGYEEADSNWTSVKMTSDSDYVQFVQGDDIQIGHTADGWRVLADIIATNLKGAIRAGQQAVDRLIKSKG